MSASNVIGPIGHKLTENNDDILDLIQGAFHLNKDQDTLQNQPTHRSNVFVSIAQLGSIRKKSFRLNNSQIQKKYFGNKFKKRAP